MSPRRQNFFKVRDLYEVLGVGRNAQKEGILVAAHSLVADLRTKRGNDPELAKQIREIRDAARVLTDPVERATYNARLMESEKHFAWLDADGEVWRVWPADDVLAKRVKEIAFGQTRPPHPKKQESEPPPPKSFLEILESAFRIALVGWFVFILFLVARNALSEEVKPTPISSWEATQRVRAAHWAYVSAVEKESSAPSWVSQELAGGALHLECPSEWTVEVDTTSEIGINGASQMFTLAWSENLTGRDTGSIIDLSNSDSEFARRYQESTAEQLQAHFAEQGCSLLGVSAPRTETIGPYQTLYVQAALLPPATSPLQQLSLLHFVFDCGAYACQAQAYKAGSEPLTLEEWRTLKRTIASIAFVE